MPTENEPGATGTAAYQNSQENVNSTSAAAPVTEDSASAEGLQTGRPERTSCDRSDSLESLGSNFSGKEEIPHLTIKIFPHNINNYTEPRLPENPIRKKGGTRQYWNTNADDGTFMGTQCKDKTPVHCFGLLNKVCIQPQKSRIRINYDQDARFLFWKSIWMLSVELLSQIFSVTYLLRKHTEQK